MARGGCRSSFRCSSCQARKARGASGGEASGQSCPHGSGLRVVVAYVGGAER